MQSIAAEAQAVVVEEKNAGAERIGRPDRYCYGLAYASQRRRPSTVVLIGRKIRMWLGRNADLCGRSRKNKSGCTGDVSSSSSLQVRMS